MKVAGRDAGKLCVIVDLIDESHFLISGETRRRKCNVKHLEPLDKVVKIKKGSSDAVLKKDFEKLGFVVWNNKSKKSGVRPKKVKKSNVVEDEKPKK